MRSLGGVLASAGSSHPNTPYSHSAQMSRSNSLGNTTPFAGTASCYHIVIGGVVFCHSK
jgi:hypothetical protein